MLSQSFMQYNKNEEGSVTLHGGSPWTLCSNYGRTRSYFARECEETRGRRRRRTRLSTGMNEASESFILLLLKMT